VRNNAVACLKRVAHAAIVVIDAHVIDRHERDKPYEFERLADAQENETGAGSRRAKLGEGYENIVSFRGLRRWDGGF